jgi:hypothetical protein
MPHPKIKKQPSDNQIPKAREEIHYTNLPVAWHFGRFDDAFSQKISSEKYLTLKDFGGKVNSIEQCDWKGIDSATHGKKGKSNSHFIKISDISKEAKKTLK